MLMSALTPLNELENPAEFVARHIGIDEGSEHHMLTAMHHFNKSRYTGERRMHEMVAVAMEENWGAIQDHIASLVGSIAELISAGVESGEFKPVADVAAVAFTVDQACCCILHPMMIAECSRLEMDGDGHAARLIEFVVNALKR